MSEAVIVSGVRTAIGNYGGALQDKAERGDGQGQLGI